MSVSRTTYLDSIKHKDYVWCGNIPADWSAIQQECEQAVKDHPECWQTLVGDRESWDGLGDDLNKELDKHRQSGYSPYNTRHWETTTIQPKLEMSWEGEIMKQLPLTNATGRPTLQPPGNVMPWHQDKFIYFKRENPGHDDHVVRFIVFQKDWQNGHLLQAGDSFVTHWKAGDILLWYPDRWHLSANVGITDKWTFNVTGILKGEVTWN